MQESDKVPGKYSWDVFGAQGNHVGGGSFTILSPEAARSARALYRRKATSLLPRADVDIGTLFLARQSGIVLE
jgi:hypothetical protein